MKLLNITEFLTDATYLYHFCSLDTIFYILHENKIRASAGLPDFIRLNQYNKQTDDDRPYISFTRNADYPNNDVHIPEEKLAIRIKLNRSLLTNNYKLEPYFQFNNDIEYNGEPLHKLKEQEERIIFKSETEYLKNIKKYIVDISIYEDVYDYNIEYLNFYDIYEKTDLFEFQQNDDAVEIVPIDLYVSELSTLINNSKIHVLHLK